MLAPLTAEDPVAVGPYRLHNRIGAGGMGTVYLAFTDQRQPVAVKIAGAELSEDVEFRRRFQREVRAARRVRGGAVATVLDADTTADRPWMVTEYVEGVSLADAVRLRGPLTDRLVRGLAAGLADALVAIHEAGVVHRDLKPSNVLLAWDGPKVIDFGIAQLDGHATLTRSGHVVGTLAWMAPEQMRGEQAAPAADVFSWGCCVAYAATGRHPFHADRAEALAFRIQRDPPDLEHLPGDLRDTVEAALAKDAPRRPAAVALLAELSGQPVRGGTDAHRATETVLERDWTRQVSALDGQRVAVGQRGAVGWAFPGPPPAWAAADSVPPLVPAPASGQPDRPQPDRPQLDQPQPDQAGPVAPYSGDTCDLGLPYDRTPYPDTSYPEPARRAPADGHLELFSAGFRPAAVSRRPGSRSARRAAGSGRVPAGRRAADRGVGGAAGAGAGWNTAAVLSVVLAVLWLFGVGSVAGVYVGYEARVAAQSRARRGDGLAAVGIVLGCLGIAAAVLCLGYLGGHG